MRKTGFLLSFLILNLVVMAQFRDQQDLFSAYSPVFRKGELIFVDLQLGINPLTGEVPHAGFDEEIHQLLQNLDELLKSNGLGYDDLLRSTVYFTDVQMLAVYERICTAQHIRGLLKEVVYREVNTLPKQARMGITIVADGGTTAKSVVRGFLEEVRSGQYPDRADKYMADSVLAHQVNSEHPVTVTRTPANYTAHVREFLDLFGRFEFTITELLAEGDKVYARWEQRGIHQALLDGYPATLQPLLEFTSAVYRVQQGKIVEYWLQTDRYGMEEQLKRNSRAEK